MKNIASIEAYRDADFGFSSETAQIAAAMSEPAGDLDTLDALVKALKASGIWGRLGEISWARDTREGLLIEWIPAA
ncbi:hypothetical protein ACFQI3_02510 [Hansschlegelia quercus]|uniref:Uncharacterized protein n=1 Tax=Hansschlegelia quercus TaxID=2528245 RepID=A0A4Q9GMV6_9HYPH|nr:hypothetical protein [Hansschlegelia quercus]TBN54801.1 hypothetical protein EYR15_01140 [Hansschlegelia quercus]